ncbi:hypothetical protein [Pseudomonas sp. G166]|uniref:hypothetical protein n=1 Tax=Pseudomonas sp. G166 TaxID=3094846 RepID=UPI003009000F
MVAALKGFAYAHLLSVSQYAQINYYLLIVGLGALVVGSGVIIKCHSEMPLLVKDAAKLSEFTSNVKWFGGGFWLIGLVGLVAYGVLSSAPLFIFILSLVQVLIFFIFTIDLMVIKSKKKFVEYARQLFFRNLMVALAGLCVAFVMADAALAILAEVCIGFLLCFRSLAGWLVNATVPGRAFMIDCLKFVPVTCVGAFMQYIDRVFAAYFMSAEEFSRFSYLSLVVMVALSIQQLINTRVITLLPEICQVSAKAGFNYVVKISLLVCMFLSVVLLCLLWLLQSRWFAAAWLDVGIGVSAVFLACAILRAADFYSAYLLVMSQKNKLLVIQIGMLGFFAVLTLLYGFWFRSGGIFAYVLLMCIGFFLSLMLLIYTSWRVSVVKEII